LCTANSALAYNMTDNTSLNYTIKPSGVIPSLNSLISFAASSDSISLFIFSSAALNAVNNYGFAIFILCGISDNRASLQS